MTLKRYRACLTFILAFAVWPAFGADPILYAACERPYLEAQWRGAAAPTDPPLERYWKDVPMGYAMPVGMGAWIRTDQRGWAALYSRYGLLARFRHRSLINIGKYTEMVAAESGAQTCRFFLEMFSRQGRGGVDWSNPRLIWPLHGPNRMRPTHTIYDGPNTVGGTADDGGDGPARGEVDLQYTVQTHQKIVYVNGADLWVMNEDGTERKKFPIPSAPAGKRIGRSVFSPDGKKMVYEVWTLNGRYPVQSDLYAADFDGFGSRLLLSAGALSDPTDRPGFSYTARVLWGPSFSPDSTKVSCLRMQVYANTRGWSVQEWDVGTVPFAGGSFNSLWKTQLVQGPGFLNDPANPFEQIWYLVVGHNTAWRKDDRIYFSGFDKWQHRYAAIVNATDTNKTAWPCQFYRECDNEQGLSPTLLAVQVDGEQIQMQNMFKGYGCVTQSGTNFVWTPHAPPEWQTPQMGAWYGPAFSHGLATGRYPVVMSVSLGAVHGSITDALGIQVVKGQVTRVEGYMEWSEHGPNDGVLSVSSQGGSPAVFLSKSGRDSLAWNSRSDDLATDWTVNGDFYGGLVSANGYPYLNTLIAHGDPENYIGGWDDTDQGIVAWSGNSGTGTVKLIDSWTGAVKDLGPGEFPAFAPLYRTEMASYGAPLWMRDNRTGRRETCTAGQRIVADDLVGAGAPAPAEPIAWPYVTNVIPAIGDAVPEGAAVTVTFQFNTPVATATMGGALLTGSSLPMPEGAEAASWNLPLYLAAFSDSGNPSAFRGTITNLEARGVGQGTWNAAATDYTFTITDPLFSRAAGNRCDVGLDISGVATAGGTPMPFKTVCTAFRFASPVGVAGGRVQSGAGGSVQVPAGALSSNVALGIAVSAAPDPGSNPPSTGSWESVSAVYQFTPTTQPLASNVTLSLPVGANYPGLSIWSFDGGVWSNLGGTFTASNQQISVSVNHLGTFCAFYQVPAGPLLQLTKGSDVSGATNGQSVRYSLVLANVGGQPASNVVVSDSLPAGLVYQVNTVSTNGSYNADLRTLSWTLGTLTNFSEVWMGFAATVTSTTYMAAITNVASVSCTGGSTGSNVRVIRVGRGVGSEPRFGCGSTRSTNLAQRAALGGGWRRVAVDITTAQARDTNLLNFAAFDAEVRANQSAGLRTYAIVSAAPTGGVWAGAGDFARAFGLYVERFDGNGVNDMPGLTNAVHHWEIFDAFVTNAGRWAGCTLEMYAQYLVAAQAEAHARDPSVTVLNSAFDNLPDGGAPNAFGRLFAEYPWAGGAVDAVSYHDRWELTPFVTGAGPVAAQYLEARDLLQALKTGEITGRETWLTEADFTATYDDWLGQGYTCSQDDLAGFIARALPGALAAGVAHVIYGEFEEKASDPAARRWAALLDLNGHRRRGFYVLQKLVEKLEGFTYAEWIDIPGGNVGARFLNSSNQPLWVVWNSTGAVSQIAVPIGPVAQFRRTDSLPASFNDAGAAWMVVTNAMSNGMARITVDDRPCYVEPVGAVNPDIDGDGLPNELDPDIDGDGMANLYEATQGLNLFVDDRHLDADKDGMSNLDEYWAGTDPQRPDSLLVCSDLTVLGTGVVFKVEWQSVSGKTYRVDWSPDLKGAWSNALDGLIYATGSNTLWYDSGPPKTGPISASGPPRFYRIRLP